MTNQMKQALEAMKEMREFISESDWTADMITMSRWDEAIAALSAQPEAAIPVEVPSVDFRALWESGVEHGYGHALRAAVPRDKDKDDTAYNEALLTASLGKPEQSDLDVMTRKKDEAYFRRNQLAIAFAKLAILLGWKAGYRIDTDQDDLGWAHVVHVEAPGGKQFSWHMSPGNIDECKTLPLIDAKWDGTYLVREDNWTNLLDEYKPAQSVSRKAIGLTGVKAWLNAKDESDPDTVTALGAAFDAIYALQLPAPQPEKLTVDLSDLSTGILRNGVFYDTTRGNWSRVLDSEYTETHSPTIYVDLKAVEEAILAQLPGVEIKGGSDEHN